MYRPHLVFLRGLPASGKSSFIQERGGRYELSRYVLSRDRVRAAIAPVSLDDTAEESYFMPALFDSTVVHEAYHEAVLARLKIGSTLILDNMHIAYGDIYKYAFIAEKIGYRITVINFTAPISELLARNNNRVGVHRVSSEVITDKADAFGRETARIANSYNLVSPEEITEEVIAGWFSAAPADTAEYERIIFIGDIHSMGSRLKNMLERYPYTDPKNLLVFTGDLFDRGEDPVFVFTTLEGAPENVRFIFGNHDVRLMHFAAGLGTPNPHQQTGATYSALKAAGITDSRILKFFSRFSPALAFNIAVHGAERLTVATHGGLSPAALDTLYDSVTERLDFGTVPASMLIYGSSPKNYVYYGKGSYKHHEPGLSHPDIIQVHGHRNGSRNQAGRPIDADPNVYNLEQGVEDGGALGVVVFDTVRERVLTRYITDAPVEEDMTLLERMYAHPNVNVQPVYGDIVGCLFTKEAFLKANWDSVTAKARGLFINKETNQIVARGYNKFFNIGQPETGEEISYPDYWSVIAAATDSCGNIAPITASRKYNGYLVLVSVIGGRLTFFTKVGESSYSAEAQRIFWNTTIPKARSALTRFILKHGCTLAFEVISHRDVHLEHVGDEQLVLLDGIYNTEDFSRVPARAIDALASACSLARPERLTVSTVAELETLERNANTTRSEGWVLSWDDPDEARESSIQMCKIKAPWYVDAKAVRQRIHRVIQGKFVDEKHIPDAAQRELFIALRNFIQENPDNVPLLEDITGARIVHYPRLLELIGYISPTETDRTVYRMHVKPKNRTPKVDENGKKIRAKMPTFKGTLVQIIAEMIKNHAPETTWDASNIMTAETVSEWIAANTEFTVAHIQPLQRSGSLARQE